MERRYLRKTDLYDICDELGVLAWQDCCFVCGNYPATDNFVANVRSEVEQNVRRLRHHASLVFLTGKMEDYGALKVGATIIKIMTPNIGRKFASPARRIYDLLMPEVFATLHHTSHIRHLRPTEARMPMIIPWVLLASGLYGRSRL